MMNWIFVAHALLRAASALLPTLVRGSKGVAMSGDTARTSACATQPEPGSTEQFDA
jgi:hypothetical protein